MIINYHEPIFTIGREPLVAGIIVARNNLRLRKQQQRRRTWNRLLGRDRQGRERPGKGQLPNGDSARAYCAEPLSKA